MEKPINNNGNKTAKKISRNPLMTNEVLEYVCLLREGTSYYPRLAAEMCDNAVIYGFMGGCRLYKDGVRLKGLNNDSGDWTESTYKAIIELKELIKGSIKFALSVTVKNGTMQDVPGFEDEFCKMWQQSKIINNPSYHNLLIEILHVSTVYLPKLQDEYEYTGEHVDMAKLMYIISNIIWYTKEAIKSDLTEYKKEIIEHLKSKFPSSKMKVDAGGKYQVTIKGKTNKKLYGSYLLIIELSTSCKTHIVCSYNAGTEAEPETKYITMLAREIESVKYLSR